ncbi:MAG: hypothetical protein SFW07_03875 [Gammaproteobacteria bacterium]|nr:hypothetical protein [Gammaproteobacteria bacterium]
MNSSNISVTEALARVKNGKTLEGISISFSGAKIKALDAFQLGKAGVDVPDELIEYNDADIAQDPEFDDYEWKRVVEDPLSEIKETITVNIELDKPLNAWIKKNDIQLAICLKS